MFLATLFDFNGVLVDDEEVHFEAFSEVLSAQGITLAREAYWQRYLGFDDRGAFEAILRDFGHSVRPEHVEPLIDAKKPSYLQRAQSGLRLFDGAPELVRQQAAMGPVGVVSGALRHEIELGLERLAVREQVAFIVAAEDTRQGKPDPEGYIQGLTWLGRLNPSHAPGTTLVVEDSYSGIEAAKLAGLCCVAVTHTYPADALRAAGADAVVTSLDAITPGFLERLSGTRDP